MITCFNKKTPEAVRKVLLDVQNRGTRIRLWYGDTKTGRSWNDEYFVTGTVGNSTGKKNHKIPILLHSARSMGGGAILDGCIIRIQTGKSVLYTHPKFHVGKWTIQPVTLETHKGIGLTHEALNDGSVWARFKSRKQAVRFVDFMTGKRMCK